jgi:hypothetical protein
MIFNNPVEKWMKFINSSDLPGKFKLWIYQFGILQRLQWPMLVYNMTSSTAEKLDRQADTTENVSEYHQELRH